MRLYVGGRGNRLSRHFGRSRRHHCKVHKKNRRSLVTFGDSLSVGTVIIERGDLSPRGLLVIGRDQAILRTRDNPLILNNVMSVTQEEIPGKEGNDEGEEACTTRWYEFAVHLD